MWQSLGDPVAADIMISGLKLFFLSEPPLHLFPAKDSVTSDKQSKALMPKVMEWKSKGRIKELEVLRPLYRSRLFGVPKKNGTLRPVIDLSRLNRRLKIPRFRMETIDKIVRQVHGELWAVSLDIEDAYLHLPLHPEFQKFFAFVLGGRTFIFLYVPFGLSTAPWAFTRVMRSVKAYLHQKCIWIFSFLDDFLLLAKDPDTLRDHLAVVIRLLLALGFNINWAKSSLIPQQIVEYLGVILNFKTLRLSVPEEKVVKVSTMALELQGLLEVSRRELERFVGLANFVGTYLPLGRLRLLPLMRWMHRHTRVATRDRKVPTCQTFKTLLAPWTDREFLSSSVPMHLSSPTRDIMTDASRHGWGGVLLPHCTSGVWTSEDKTHPINWLELKAIQLTLEEFAPQLEGRTVRVLSDSLCALACLRRQGCLRSDPLMDLSVQILEFCQRLHITLVPVHLAGVLNVLADQHSRESVISTEWTLDDRTFSWIVREFGQPEVDLFATRFNKRIAKFVSPCPDHQALAWDAMAQDWNEWESIYAFPPVSLIPEVIWKSWSHRRGGSHNRAILEECSLVPSTVSAVRDCDSPSGDLQIVSDSEGGNGVSPEPLSFPPRRVEAIRLGLQRKGFSRATADMMAEPHKPSTLNQYQGCWGRFLSFLSSTQVTHSEVTVATIADFLLSLHSERNREYGTIRVHKCALALPLRSLLGLDINSPECELLLQGMYAARPPRRCIRVPSDWPLEGVLQHLSGPPFEPLEEASVEDVLTKTLFLVLLGCGRRSGDIAALTRSVQKTPERVWLQWHPRYRAKKDNAGFRSWLPSIVPLRSEVAGSEVLCPVRALDQWMLLQESDSCTLPARSGSLWPFGQRKLDSVVINLIKTVCRKLDISVPQRVGMHLIRKLAASFSNQLVANAESKMELAQHMGCKNSKCLEARYIFDTPVLKCPISVPAGIWEPPSVQ